VFDKSVTIKGATDKQLDELLVRLRKEQEIQGLITEIKRKSSSGYVPYDHNLEVSTEKPIEDLYHSLIHADKTVDKSATIKDATDEQLDALIIRLRKELQIQSIIGDIKRKTLSGYISYDQNQEVSTEKPIEDLYHFGILGMKWGRRNSKATGKPTAKKTSSDGADSEDHLKKLSLKNKKLSAMTNAELKAFNERMQLERTYKDLTKTEISPGRKFVNELIATTAKEVATNYVKKYANKGVEQLLKKAAK
jgi:hypothetical protein